MFDPPSILLPALRKTDFPPHVGMGPIQIIPPLNKGWGGVSIKLEFPV